MKIFASIIASAAAFSLPAAAIAQDEQCVSRAESQAVVAHLLPNLLTSVGAHCGKSLGGTSYLAANGARLGERMQSLADRSWPTTRAVFERQGGAPLPDNDAILDLGRMAIADGIAKGMDEKACAIADNLTEQLAPLPPQNFANVFALFLEAGLNEAKDSPIKVCEA